jgi:hypothetical protein
MKDSIPFPSSYAHFFTSLPHIHFSHFDDTCNLGSNDSTKLKESFLFFIPFWRAVLALVLECYVDTRK